ncbi:MAG: glycoside hydrolase family 65 protein [Clostridia bacterium]|nr:glycoside hydrolase family 65 protein [Clostridia bacterium]
MLKYDLGSGAKENWLIAETDFDIDHQGKCEAIFCQGNGYLGQRAALEEKYVGQTRDLLVTGTFNRFDENEVCELPNLPDVTNLDFLLDGQYFAMDRGSTEGYSRVMDLYTGEVTRTLIWTRRDGRRFSFRFERFASLDNEHLLGIRACVTPLDGPCEITLNSGINGQVTCTGSQHFHEGDKRVIDGKIFRMVSQTIQSNVTCALHTAFRYAVDGAEATPKWWPVIDRRYLGVKAVFSLLPGQTLAVEKITCVTTSRDLKYDGRENAAELAQKDGYDMAVQAIRAGYDALAENSCRAWEAFWRGADIRVESEKPFDQLLIRFALYHLNIMAKKDDPRVGIGAKGMTGEGYKGHSFWDTEIFILPYFILTQPEAAKALVTYRYNGLYGARKKAAENGFEGAMYPWEAAWIDDGEVTPLWGSADIVTGKPIPILTGMIEQHITADVAFGVQLYHAVTGDEAFMDHCGWEIIIDTARFWASRFTWDEEKQAYVILDVIGPDEYKEHVNNNAYTNYMAVNNMKLALGAIDGLLRRNDDTCRRLDEKLNLKESREKIQAVMEKAYLPQPDVNGIVPQFDGYFDLMSIDLTPYKTAQQVGTIYQDYNNEQISRIQVHKQADTLVLMLLMDDLFPHDVKVKNYYFYEARTLHDSSLSKSTHCVLAADLGEEATAYRFFEGCGQIDLGPNMGTSDMGVHTASMGGIWQCAVYGFGGVRVVGRELHVDPKLPAAWRALSFPLVWRGQALRVTADPQGVTVENAGTAPVDVILRGEKRRVLPGEKAEG